MKRWATFAAVVFALHFGWELMQSKWFASMMELPFWRAALLCARATLGDLLITAIAFGVAAIVGKSVEWPAGPRVVIATSVFVIVGVAVTAGYEVFALATGRWRYDDTMPTLFGIGATPLLQWLILPLIEVGLFRFIAPGLHRVGSDQLRRERP